MVQGEEATERVRSTLFALVLVTLTISTGVSTITGRVLYLGAALVIAVWLAATGSNPPKRSLAIAGLLVAAYAVAIAAGDAPRLSLEAALPVLLGVAVLVFCASTRLSTTVIVNGCGLALAVVTVWALGRWVSQVGDWMRAVAVADPSSTLLERMPVTLVRAGIGSVHPNGLAMMLEVGLPLTVIMALRAGRSRIIWRTLSVVAAAVLVMTGSRGGWAGALIGLGVALIAYKRRGTVGLHSRLRMAAAVAGVAVCVTVALLVTEIRPSWLFRGTLIDRAAAIEAGVQMFLADATTGRGPGTFLLLLDGYIGDENYAGVGRVVWSHAHNAYVQVLLEVGLVGLTLLVIATILLLQRALGAVGAEDRPQTQALAAAVLGSAAGLAVHGLVDVVTIWVGPVVLFAALAGVLLREDASPQTRRARWLAMAWVLPAPLLLAAAMPAQVVYEQGHQQALAGDWALAQERFSTAWRLDPYPAYRLAATIASINAGLVESENDLNRLLETAERVPFDVPAQLNVMMAASRLGAGQDAVERLGPVVVGDEVALFQLGAIYEELGRSEQARSAYLRALRINPWIIDSPAWAGVEAGLRSGLLDQLGGQDPCRTLEVITLLGIPDVTLGSARCSMAHSDLYRWVAREDWSQVSSAVADRILRSPDDVTLRRFEGMAAEAGGDIGKARRSWTIAALLGDVYSAARLVDSYGSQPVPSPILDLASSIVHVSTPVRQGVGPHTVYVLGASRFQVTYQRRTLTSPLSGGAWEGLATEFDKHFVGQISEQWLRLQGL